MPLLYGDASTARACSFSAPTTLRLRTPAHPHCTIASSHFRSYARHCILAIPWRTSTHLDAPAGIAEILCIGAFAVISLLRGWTHSPKGENVCKALAGNYQPAAPEDDKAMALT